MSLTPSMVRTLWAMVSQYNSAKAEDQVPLFIALAREALWKVDPPDISFKTDAYTVRAFEKTILNKIEAISLANHFAPCPQWEAVMWLSAGLVLSRETTDCEDSQSTTSEPAEGETTDCENSQPTTDSEQKETTDHEDSQSTTSDSADSEQDSDDAVIITPGVRSQRRKIRIWLR